MASILGENGRFAGMREDGRADAGWSNARSDARHLWQQDGHANACEESQAVIQVQCPRPIEACLCQSALLPASCAWPCSISLSLFAMPYSRRPNDPRGQR